MSYPTTTTTTDKIMAKLDLNGIPSIVVAESTSTGQALGAPLVTPTPLSNSIGGIVRDMLAQFADDAFIVIDPVSRKVTGASGAAGIALRAATVATVEGPNATIQPDAGQEGRSLTFSAEDADLLSQEQQDAIAAAIAAAKPKRTVESLVTALAGADYTVGERPTIFVDQIDGFVFVKNAAEGAVQAAVDALANAGDRVQIVLAEPAEDPGVALAVFEGGAV